MNKSELAQVVDKLATLWARACKDYDNALRKHGTPSVEEQRAWSIKERIAQAYESASTALDELSEK